MARREKIEKLWREKVGDDGQVYFTGEKNIKVTIDLGKVRGVVRFPNDGESVEIEYLHADGGPGKGEGNGRRVVDLSIQIAGELGYKSLDVANGSAYWNMQNDFELTLRRDDDVTHTRKLR